jgi:hypothetical protein
MVEKRKEPFLVTSIERIDGQPLSFGEVNSGLEQTSPILIGSSTLTDQQTNVFVDCTGGNIQLDLPNVSDVPGRIYHIKKVDESSNHITLNPFGAQKIDNKTELKIIGPYSTASIICDGSKWWIQ